MTHVTDYAAIINEINASRLSQWADTLAESIDKAIFSAGHGDLHTWIHAIESLPTPKISSSAFNESVIRIGTPSDVTPDELSKIKDSARIFMPWRKGPFDLCGLLIDTEWRSDLKWDRLLPHIKPLKNRIVLDVGCGSGYHTWRMSGEGARLAIGIEPMLLYVFQYLFLQHFAREARAAVFPFSLETLATENLAFDTVFSMGVLYHARSPIDHLLSLKKLLCPGGELVLETLIIDSAYGDVFMPEDRYSKMRNVWFLPSVATLERWLKRCKFHSVRCVDVTKTTSDEQRMTEWMDYESLPHFLDPSDPTKTVEGYPAPVRAIFIAEC
jgi:tRNA (mo5U34)-methyltransferase